MAEQQVLEKLRVDAAAILAACLEAADPEKAVRGFLAVRGDRLVVGSDLSIDLDKCRRILVVGAGKASAPMAKAVEDLLGDRIREGAVSVKYGHGMPLRRIQVIEAGHPLPDESGERAAQRIMDLLRPLNQDDLVISCISGGGSALLPAVPEGVTLQEKQDLTQHLLSAGADIHEMNAVRKHLSLTKGGNLMRSAFPAFVVNLMLSDVVGDDPDTIASGPFVPDRSTFADVMAILGKYSLEDRVSESIRRRIEEGVKTGAQETPKQGDPIFARARNIIVGSNILSLEAGRDKAMELGYRAAVLSSTIEGDTTEAAVFHAAVGREIRSTGNPVKPAACVLSGGETTVVVKGRGKGGRNQHFALSLVRKASEIADCLFLSTGTDGTDGPTDAAGAWVDTHTLERAAALGLNPDLFLADNDAYHFFEPLGDLIITGPTRTNVMDVRMILVG
jgi:glycerate 2-kinase